jgi:hypothetical protein
MDSAKTRALAHNMNCNEQNNNIRECLLVGGQFKDTLVKRWGFERLKAFGI